MTGRPFVMTSVAALVLLGACAERPNAPMAAPSTATATASPFLEEPTKEERELMRALIRFARSPGAESLDAVPFAEKVWLGLGRHLHLERPRDELADPAGWVLSARLFRAWVGPFSALDLLAGRDDRHGPGPPETSPGEVRVGPHPHCASPPVPPPSRVKDLRRVSVQAAGGDSCITWWTVDAFVNGNGEIAAVTLDLWEP